MKFLKKMLILSILITTASLNIIAVTSDDIFPNGARFSRGVENTCFYIHPSASSYANIIRTRANNWMYTGWGNLIYMYEVNTSYATHMDIYKDDYSPYLTNTGYGAVTMFFDSNGNRLSAPPKVDYFYTEIIFSGKDINTQDSNGDIAHEMGHAFGLNHNNTRRDRLMYGSSYRTRTVPLKEENDIIQYLY